MFFIRLFLANTRKKNRGSPRLFPYKLLWKVDMVLRWQLGWIICAAETGARYKIAPIVFEVCTRHQAFCGCFHVFDIANTENQTWKEYNKYQEWGKSRFDEILELSIFVLDYFVAPALQWAGVRFFCFCAIMLDKETWWKDYWFLFFICSLVWFLYTAKCEFSSKLRVYIKDWSLPSGSGATVGLICSRNIRLSTIGVWTTYVQ